jgi:hypothetical protein
VVVATAVATVIVALAPVAGDRDRGPRPGGDRERDRNSMLGSEPGDRDRGPRRPPNRDSGRGGNPSDRRFLGGGGGRR